MIIYPSPRPPPKKNFSLSFFEAYRQIFRESRCADVWLYNFFGSSYDGGNLEYVFTTNVSLFPYL